jgi:hypothetical protein
MALPSLIDRGRIAGQRHRSERDRQPRSYAASLADTVGAGDWNSGDVSGHTCAAAVGACSLRRSGSKDAPGATRHKRSSDMQHGMIMLTVPKGRERRDMQ